LALQASKRTGMVSHRPKGRKRGSGYRSQLLMLLILTNGAASSSDIKQLSGLDKNTICYNLRILKGIRAVIVERKGKTIIYRLRERPFWKWLFFHAFGGTRWAWKALKAINRLFDLLIKMKPIKEMYSLVRNNAELYEGLKEKYPELKDKDVWNATWLVEQYRYVKQADKYKNRPIRPWTKKQVGKEKWRENRKVQRKNVGERCSECGGTNLIKDYDTNETVCGACGIVIREQETEDFWIGSRLVPRGKEPQRNRYLENQENFAKFCRQLCKGFREQVQKTLVGKITLALYHDFLQTCFPEIIDFAAEHRIKDYERLPFDHAIKFDKLVTQLVKKRVDKVEEFFEELKREIDYVHDYTIRFLRSPA